jgi:hypothetical protein
MKLPVLQTPERILLVSALILLSSLSALPQNATYVSVKKCKACHLKQFITWSATKMASAFELLKPGVRPEAKIKFKQDPKKDYTHDASCLPCHTTGYGRPGGFRSIEETPDLAGVQCEACHGAGSEVLKVMTIQNKSYKRSEVLAAGLEVPNEKTCKGQCHNSKSPFVGANYIFDYPSRKTKGTHEHLPLKFPHN